MENPLQRITLGRTVLDGKPVIRGLRISVEAILDLMRRGAGEREILKAYPQLEPADIEAALSYAQYLGAGDVFVD